MRWSSTTPGLLQEERCAVAIAIMEDKCNITTRAITVSAGAQFAEFKHNVHERLTAADAAIEHVTFAATAVTVATMWQHRTIGMGCGGGGNEMTM